MFIVKSNVTTNKIQNVKKGVNFRKIIFFFCANPYLLIIYLRKQEEKIPSESTDDKTKDIID